MVPRCRRRRGIVELKFGQCRYLRRRQCRQSIGRGGGGGVLRAAPARGRAKLVDRRLPAPRNRLSGASDARPFRASGQRQRISGASSRLCESHGPILPAAMAAPGQRRRNRAMPKWRHHRRRRNARRGPIGRAAARRANSPRPRWCGRRSRPHPRRRMARRAHGGRARILRACRPGARIKIFMGSV